MIPVQIPTTWQLQRNLKKIRLCDYRCKALPFELSSQLKPKQFSSMYGRASKIIFQTNNAKDSLYCELRDHIEQLLPAYRIKENGGEKGKTRAKCRIQAIQTPGYQKPLRHLIFSPTNFLSLPSPDTMLTLRIRPSISTLYWGRGSLEMER